MLVTANLNRFPNYLKRFGVVAGTRLFTQVYCSRGALRVTGYPNPVWIRRTASDTATFFQIIVKDEYDPRHWPQYRRLRDRHNSIIARGRVPVIVDGGGNIGLTAIWFARLFPDASIYTIEPDSGNLEVLRRNVTPYSNIHILPGGVWHRSCRLRIQNPDAGSAMFRLAESDDGEIRGYSIDEIASLPANGDLFIVKLDIEGGEKFLFDSNVDWVAAVPLIAIETHDWLFPGEASSHSFWGCVSRLNADVLFRDENVFVFNSN